MQTAYRALDVGNGERSAEQFGVGDGILFALDLFMLTGSVGVPQVVAVAFQAVFRQLEPN